MYDATSIVSVSTLANKLLSAKYLREPVPSRIAAAIIAQRLMLGPIWFRVLCGFLKLRGNYENRILYFVMHVPDLANSIIDNTADWMVRGSDKEDLKSVGGFSQREVNLLVEILKTNKVL
jgi:hypothetical protein